MKFLAPSLLYFLPLAFLPLVIYFLVFRRALRVSFPGLYILRRVYEKNIRGRRFRRAAVLALRCAAAGLLVLAFSRPVLERAPGAWRSGAVRDTPLSVVLLIDTSYSMRTELAGRTVFDMAKNAGLAVLSGMTPEDKAAFGVFSDGWEGAPLAWTAPSEAAARMASLKPGWRTTAYRTALENAYAFLASQDKGRKAIIVLTDGFSQGFKSLAPGGIESVKGYNSAIAVYGLSFPSETGNVWAESVSFNGAELLDGGLKSVPALAASFGGSGTPAPALTASADIKGIKTRRNALKRSTGGSMVSRWFLDGKLPALVSGKVSVSPDALPDDNTRYFSYRVPQAPKLLCLSSDPLFLRRGHGGYFLQSVLGRGITGFNCDFFDFARMADIKLSEYKGVLVAGVSEISAPQAEILGRFVKAGGNLFLSAGPGLQMSGLRFVEDLLPVRVLRFENSDAKNTARLVPPKDAVDFPWSGYQLEKVKVGTFAAASLKPGCDADWTISARGSVYPALAHGRVGAGSGSVYFWTPGFETVWTDFPLKPAFPVWAAYVAAKLGSTRISPESIETLIGRPFKIPTDSADARPVTVTSPSGASRELRPEKGEYVFSETGEPGLYSVLDRGGIFSFAVNPDFSSGESDLTVRSNPGWQTLDFSNPADDFFSRQGGLDLFGPLLALALLCLAAEFFLAVLK